MHTKIIITITEFEDIKGQITEEIKNTGYKKAHNLQRKHNSYHTYKKIHTVNIYVFVCSTGNMNS